jgi:hypothetical protein
VVEKTRGKHGPERQPQSPEDRESSKFEPCNASNRVFAEETEQDPPSTYISFKTEQRIRRNLHWKQDKDAQYRSCDSELII